MSKYYHKVKIVKQLTVKTTQFSAEQVAGGLTELDLGVDRPCGGYLDCLFVIDDDDEKAAMNVYLFDEQPTAFADGETFAPTVNDLKKLAGLALLSAADYRTLNGNAIGTLTFPVTSGFGFKTQNGRLYLYLVPTGTPTYSAANALSVVVRGLVQV